MKVFVERLQGCDHDTAFVGLHGGGSASSRRWGRHCELDTQVHTVPEHALHGEETDGTGQKTSASCRGTGESGALWEKPRGAGCVGLSAVSSSCRSVGEHSREG